MAVTGAPMGPDGGRDKAQETADLVRSYFTPHRPLTPPVPHICGGGVKESWATSPSITHASPGERPSTFSTDRACWRDIWNWVISPLGVYVCVCVCVSIRQESNGLVSHASVALETHFIEC